MTPGRYYQDDTPLEPHEDEMYDDAPHARRHSGLVTALALIGLRRARYGRRLRVSELFRRAEFNAAAARHRR